MGGGGAWENRSWGDMGGRISSISKVVGTRRNSEKFHNIA